MTGTSTASTTQRSTRQRELNLGTLQSGQEEDFTSTQVSYNNNNNNNSSSGSNQLSSCMQQTRTTTPVQLLNNMSSSSTSSNMIPPKSTSAMQQPMMLDTKNLYYNRFINKHPPAQPASAAAVQTSIPKTSSTYDTKSPTKLKYQSTSTVTTSTTSSSCTSFPPPSSTSSSSSSSNNVHQQRVIYTSQHETLKQLGTINKHKYPISSIVENTPPQSPLCSAPIQSSSTTTTTPTPFQMSNNKQLDDSNEIHSTINEVVSPLKANRLRPLRQQTRNAVMNILDSNEVVLEFIKAKNAKQRIIEVIRISPDGDKIMIYQPNSGKGFPVTDRPTSPPRDKGHFLEYDYQTLPQKYWKKYLYASRFVLFDLVLTFYSDLSNVCWPTFSRFVKLVRSKTPKITLYTTDAKCMLMENSPDFEVHFYNGTKFSMLKDGVKIVNSDGSSLMLDPNSKSTFCLSPDTQSMLDSVYKWHNFCLEEENIHEKRQVVYTDILHFPLVIGRRPQSHTDLSVSASQNLKASTTVSQQQQQQRYADDDLDIDNREFMLNHKQDKNDKTSNSRASSILRYSPQHCDSPVTFNTESMPTTTTTAIHKTRNSSLPPPLTTSSHLHHQQHLYGASVHSTNPSPLTIPATNYEYEPPQYSSNFKYSTNRYHYQQHQQQQTYVPQHLMYN
jgi:hypothetical protein